MPNLPIEIVRSRVKRAAELGLPYKTYAGVRAATGHDLIGFLFSSNALHMYKEENLRQVVSDKLITLKAERVALVYPPLHPELVAENEGIDAGYRAPRLLQSWSQTRRDFLSFIKTKKVSADRYLVIGQGDLEKEWLTAGGFAGFITGDVFFERRTT